VSRIQDARHFASWFGLTPNEYSSGSSRYLGHISKRGDRYLRASVLELTVRRHSETLARTPRVEHR
jgi:transposase